MKKLLCVAVIGFMISCGNDKTEPAKTESAPITPGIDNTNGNIPDSSTTIRLNQPLPIDSSAVKDSM